MMKFDNYLFRCHMVGYIICAPKPLTKNQAETLAAYRERINNNGKPLTEKQTLDWHSLEVKEAKSKIYKLTSVQETILSNLAFYEQFGRKKRLENKYFDNGLATEKQGRDLLSEVLNVPLIADNERKSNNFVTGKRDIKHSDLIIDIKSSYSFETFNKHLTDKESETYLYQLDSYMDLWGIENSLLAYVLIDTPFKLIDDELRRADWKYNLFDINGNANDSSIEQIVQIVNEFIYTEKHLKEYCNQSFSVNIEWFKDFVEIPKENRVHLVPHEFDKTRIEQRNESIKIARKFMNDFKLFNNITI